jgi:hypothetical protein
VSSAHGLASPPAGGRQSTSTTDAPCERSASANVESPRLTASTLSQHVHALNAPMPI